MIRLLLVSLMVERGAALSTLFLFEEFMVNADCIHGAQFTNNVRVIPVAARFIPAFVAIEIPADQKP